MLPELQVVTSQLVGFRYGFYGETGRQMSVDKGHLRQPTQLCMSFSKIPGSP